MTISPYLTRDEVNDCLKQLGFDFQDQQLVDTPEGRKKFTALQSIIIAAIADWADVDDDMVVGIDVNQQLLEWTEEFLVG